MWEFLNSCYKVNGDSFGRRVTTGHCLLFRNEVKLQLNIDTIVSYQGTSKSSFQILLRLCYSQLSEVTSVSEVSPTFLNKLVS